MRLIRILLSAVILLAIGLVVLVVALPGERIAKLASDQVKTHTGRELVFEGKVGISWFPVFGVSTGPVSLSNAAWSDGGPMFRADKAAIGVDVMSLISGDIRLTRIEAENPDVRLEISRDGQANWEFGATTDADAPSTDSGESGSGALILENLNIKNARLRYVDHGGDSFEISNLDASLKWPDPRKPADIALTLRPAAEDVSLTAAVTDLEALLTGSVSNLTARVEAAGATVSFDGRAGITPQFAGLLDATIPRPDQFMAALGLPEAGIAGPASMRGQVTLTKDGRFSLRDGSLTALGNSLSAQADVETAGAKPVVTAQFVAGKLDLSAASGNGGQETSGVPSSGWSKAPIDASALGIVDGEIALAAEAIDLGNLKLGRSRIVATIDNSRAVFRLNEVNAYDGLVTGQFVANNRSGLSVGGKMDVAGVELNKALSDMMDVDRLSGKANASLSFLGVGQSVHEIMNSLKGDASFKVGQGTISGIDLDRLFRGRPGGGTTVFDALSATAVIEAGVLTNEDLLLELPNIEAKGAGTVGLGARNIDYVFTPQVGRNEDEVFAVPIRIVGSWDDPSIRPELDKALGVDLDAEKEKLKDEADALLKEKVSEELNLAPETDLSPEEAIKDSLEQKAKDSLLKLLGD